MTNSKEYSRKYRETHKEQMRLSRRKYYETHKEKEKEKKKKYAETHKEQIIAYRKKYYQEHKERADALHREWNRNHKKRNVEMTSKSKWKRVLKLREQGVANAWSVVNYGKEPKYLDDLCYDREEEND